MNVTTLSIIIGTICAVLGALYGLVNLKRESKSQALQAAKDLLEIVEKQRDEYRAGLAEVNAENAKLRTEVRVLTNAIQARDDIQQLREDLAQHRAHLGETLTDVDTGLATVSAGQRELAEKVDVAIEAIREHVDASSK